MSSDKPNLTSLDSFGRKYLMGAEDKDILIEKGNANPDKVQEIFYQRAKEDFINRAGSFTEDLVGFIIEQKQKRALDDKSVIFSLALASINLHTSFCAPQNTEEQKSFNPDQKQALSKEWDEICYAAQCYYDENK
jgi:ribonucleotide reductase beta subunit family protein with ferritin-like domain